jgi:AcrR family transcriptional regulator
VPLPPDEPAQADDHAAAKRPGGRSARVQAAVFTAAAELLREADWSRISMARIAERAGVTSSTVYRRWGSLENLVRAMIDVVVSERSPLPDTGTLAGDVRAHSVTLVDDLTGENRRFLLRALIIAGNDVEEGANQPPLAGRSANVQAMFDRAAARGEPSVDLPGYFDAVVGPLYGYALMLPGLVRWHAPTLVERFLARLDRAAAAHGERDEPGPAGREPAPHLEGAPEGRPPRRTRSDTEANRDRLLAAAASVMTRAGRQVPLSAIAAEAGVGVGTLYRRYADRDALMQALELRAYALLTGILGDIAPRELTGLEAIGEFLARTLEIADHLVLPLHGAPPLVTPEAVAAREEINVRLEGFIARGRADGTVNAPVNATDIIVFSALVTQPLAHGPDWEQIAARQLAVFLNGLAGDGPRRIPGPPVTRAEIEKAFGSRSAPPG